MEDGEIIDSDFEDNKDLGSQVPVMLTGPTSLTFSAQRQKQIDYTKTIF